MRRLSFPWSVGCVLLAIATTGACSSGDAPSDPAAGPATTAGAATRDGARTLPIPGSELPPGHPPTEGVPSGPLTWRVPQHWIDEAPSNSMRVAQYRVPGPAGDAECVVFYFGPGQGGDPMANARRWANQFTQPDGRPSEELMEVARLESASIPLHVVQVTGTYSGGMSGIEEQTDSMLLGGIAEAAEAPWFFKFTGPEETVRAEQDAFMSMLESVAAGG